MNNLYFQPKTKLEKPIPKKQLTFKEKFSRKAKEIKNDFKIKLFAILFFLFAGFLFWLLMQLLQMFYGFSILAWIKSVPYVYDLFRYFINEINLRSNLGVFYLFLFSSLFFLPIPLEALYFKLLSEGIPIQTLFPIVLFGIILGQIINYFLGRFLGFLFIAFIKRKTRKSIKRKLSKYGVIAVVGVHLIPFPFQVFNFISGILRYKFFKWIFFVTIGLVIKHIIMYFIYLAFI